MHRILLVTISVIVIGLGGAAHAQEQNVTAIEDVAPAPRVRKVKARSTG